MLRAARTHPLIGRPWIGIAAKGVINRMAYGLNPMPQLTGVGSEVGVTINAAFILALTHVECFSNTPHDRNHYGRP